MTRKRSLLVKAHVTCSLSISSLEIVISRGSFNLSGFVGQSGKLLFDVRQNSSRETPPAPGGEAKVDLRIGVLAAAFKWIYIRR